MLLADRLQKTFDDIHAVRSISLQLPPGRIMGLVGASGSGKSTLLSVLAGLLDADGGTVTLNGKRVPGPSEVLVAGHNDIRLVHQEYQLMPNISLRENIAYAVRFYEKEYQRFRVDELVKLCRLEAVQDHLPRQASGGEKQRTAIARAIAEKPAVLLLDEPFSHLDLLNRTLIRDLLFDLVRQEQTACLFVTHDATDALSIADEVGILQMGHLIQTGSPVAVYRRPVTAYAARMTGPANIIRAKRLSSLELPASHHPDACFCLRPEQIHLSETGVPATVTAVFFKGSHFEVEVDVNRYVRLRLLTTRAELKEGTTVHLHIGEEAVWWLK
ncbi:ABC transporter ATP-binding protein [Nibrella saemangeumensis]|uniref:ABC transporter ATP-binding protein n=1 Tax=Nibrella saemangeumensis TaxID=1084526 RepID=A0ABP8NRB1_9BACT